MSKLKFTKMVGAGNDFVVIDANGKDYSKIAQVLCQRKTGVGADGLLVLERSGKADFRMRIFNADGSEAEMCGNGLRCAALKVHPIPQGYGAGKCTPYHKGTGQARAPHTTRVRGRQEHKFRIETKAGIYMAEVTGKNRVKIKMEEPKDLRLSLNIAVNKRVIKVNYIDTGVPHAVIFVQGIDDINVDSIGRGIRYHEEFKPRGTNVDFVEIIDDKNIKMRTYERGIEGETLACGTGAVASAIVTAHKSTSAQEHKVNVHAKGGILKVYFKKAGNKVKDVYLEGEARKVFTGEVDYVK